MSELEQELSRLLDFLGLSQDHVTHLKIVEISPHTRRDSKGRFCIARAGVYEPKDYAERFQELLDMKYSWLNMSCYGLLEGALFVAIEIPDDESKGTSKRTSVNKSGPRGSVVEDGGDARSVLLIE